MLRGFCGRFILTASVLCTTTAAANDTSDLRLPPGTSKDPAGHYIAGRGLRDSTDFVAKELGKRGIAVEQIGPYRVRNVELTRFISQSESTSWLAIHILRMNGKTMIFFVARPST